MIAVLLNMFTKSTFNEIIANVHRV